MYIVCVCVRESVIDRARGGGGAGGGKDDLEFYSTYTMIIIGTFNSTSQS